MSEKDIPMVEIKHKADRDGKMMCYEGGWDDKPCNLMHKEYTHGGTDDDCYINAAIWEPCNRYDHGQRYNEMCPGPSCPGPGKFKLMRWEDGDE